MACPHCNDTGWRPIDREGVRRVERCECWRAKLTERAQDLSGIPARYRHAEIENFKTLDDSLIAAADKAKRLVQAFPAVDRGLIFLGEPGVGKTHLAVGILKALVRKCAARAVFFEVNTLLAQLRETYASGSDRDEADVLRPIIDAEVLVLDDLGVHRFSDWVEEMLNLIVNSRYNSRRLTIFTTNCARMTDTTDARSLLGRVGQRVYSRLHEMCDFVEFVGQDHREHKDPGNPTADDLTRVDKKGSASHQPVQRGGRAMIKAQFAPKGHPDLKWSGGKAGR